jgi:hypothetical protein
LNITDNGTRLVIDPITRTIAPKYRNQKAVYVAKGDHNSTLITFEIPRYVDGNDMSDKENVIQIHYVNMDAEDEKNISRGFFDAINVKVEQDETTGNEIVSFAWLIPNTATRYAGVVSIGITFERFGNIDNNVEEVYSWSTSPYGKTIVWDSHDNSSVEVGREYNHLVETCNAIVYTALRSDFNYLIDEALQKAKESGDFKGDKGEKGERGNAFTYDDFTSEQLAGLKGEKGDKGDNGELTYSDAFTIFVDKDLLYSALETKADKSTSSNALKGSASGVSVLAVNDISPIEHDMSVKVSSKNLVYTPYLLTETTIKGITFTAHDDGSVKIVGTTTESQASVNIQHSIYISHLVGTTLCLRGADEANIRFFGHLYYDDGTVTYNYYRTDQKDKIARVVPEGANRITFGVEVKTGTYDTVVYPQLEIGTVPTDFTQYVDISTVTLSRVGKNIMPTDTSDGDYPIYLPKGTTITQSNDEGGLLMLIHLDGNFMPMSVGTYTLTEDVYAVAWEMGKVSNGQLELGSVATPYEPFIKEEYTPNADGVIEGVTSISPITTLTSNTKGVVIEAEYNRDVNKAFAAQQAEIEELKALILELTTK